MMWLWCGGSRDAARPPDILDAVGVIDDDDPPTVEIGTDLSRASVERIEHVDHLVDDPVDVRMVCDLIGWAKRRVESACRIDQHDASAQCMLVVVVHDVRE